MTAGHVVQARSAHRDNLPLLTAWPDRSSGAIGGLWTRACRRADCAAGCADCFTAAPSDAASANG